MKRLIGILVLLAAFQYAYSVEIVGSFLGVNGIKIEQFAVWNRTTESFVPQYHLSSAFSTRNAAIQKSTGHVYYYDGNGVFVWNTTTTMRVGGVYGYFIPQNRISNIAVSSRKLYVCGTFEHIGPVHSRLNVTTGKGPQIVEFDVSDTEQHLLFEQKYSLLPEYPHDFGVDCASMTIVGDILVVKDSNTGTRRYLQSGAWESMTSVDAKIRDNKLYVAEVEGTVYAIAQDLNNPSNPPTDPYLIQKYSFQDKKWTTVVDDTHDTTFVGRIAVGQNSDEIYMAYSSSTTEDPTRHQKVFLWNGNSVKRIGKGRFSSALTSTYQSIANAMMHYDTNLKTLVLANNNFNYYVFGDDETIVDRTWEYYAKKVNKIVYYEPINDTFIQAYGGGFDQTPSAIINGENNITYFRGVGIAYNTFAPSIARLNKDTMKFESLFPLHQNGLDHDKYFNNDGSITDFALFNGGKSAYIAGQFRSIANETRNSIALIHEDGTTEPLGQEPHVGVRNWGGSLASATISPGTVSHMIHFEKEQFLYVAGEFQLAGNATVSNIARYNIKTKTWHDVDGGVSGSINAMIYSSEFNSIFVAGSISRAGNKNVNKIARFNLKTQEWESLNDGLDADVYALTMYKGRLIASGPFSTAAGHKIHSYVAVWDGYHWTHLYNYVSGSSNCQESPQCSISGDVPTDFVEAHGYLYLRGGSNRVYQYDGSQFKYLGFTAQAITRDYKNRLLVFSSGKLHVYNHKTDNLELLDDAAYHGSIYRTSGAAGLYANVVLIVMSLILFSLF